MLHHYSERLIEKSNTLSWQIDHDIKFQDNQNIVLFKLEFLGI